MRKVLIICLMCVSFAMQGYAQDSKAKPEPRDEFFWLSQINKATIVTNLKSSLLTAKEANEYAKALATVIKKGQEGGPRPTAALRYEPLLIAESSPDITKIHAGRSSQDMHATYRAMIFRDDLLALSTKLNQVRELILELASENMDTIVPNYTNGVMAQPNLYAHYLLGFAAAFERDQQRIEDTYSRYNKSAMGTTVLNGTSWNLNRVDMARYLGFDGMVENAYDAGQLASVDQPIEIGAITQGIAIHISLFLEDLMPQYSQSMPWILLDRGATYASTAMPQKRNPGLINTARRKASRSLSTGIEAALVAHNITPGMSDPKIVSENKMIIKSSIDALVAFEKVVKALRVNKERALDEVNSDWITSQELADILMRDYGVPFRVGHHYASMLVDYGRANGIRPLDFPYDEAVRIYAEAIKEYSPSSALPLSPTEFKAALDPVATIKNRKTAGSANPTEVAKMMKNAETNLANSEKWVSANVKKIDDSLLSLDKEFGKLLK